jgi:hypothetical protein
MKKKTRAGSDLVESPPVIRQRRRTEPEDEVYSEEPESENEEQSASENAESGSEPEESEIDSENPEEDPVDSEEERFNEAVVEVAVLDDAVVEGPQPFPDFDGRANRVLQGTRRSGRVAQNGLQAAFRPLVDDGDYEQFLQRPIINQLFAQAYEAYTKFGQGHGARDVEEHWLLHWTDDLKTKSVFQVLRGLEKLANDNPNDDRFQRALRRFQEDLDDSHCLFCRLRRNLTVCTYDTSGEMPVYLGLIGADCWNIRFQPLLDLVDTCRRLALSADHPDFDLIARRHIEACIQKIVEAPAVMADAYRHLRQ